MARQARLAFVGLMHYVWLRAHNGAAVLGAGPDRELFLDCLREAAAEVQVHGYAMLDSEVHLLLRPGSPAALSLAMQALGRRFVAAYNRRHQRSGTLWDGRYRAAVVEPGAQTLMVLRRVDRLGGGEAGRSSASSRLAGVRWPMLVDPPELWALGNTPFEREARYRELLAQPLPASLESAIGTALRGGRVIGGESFVDELSRQAQRRLRPAPRGRPPGSGRRLGRAD